MKMEMGMEGGMEGDDGVSVAEGMAQAQNMKDDPCAEARISPSARG